MTLIHQPLCANVLSKKELNTNNNNTLLLYDDLAIFFGDQTTYVDKSNHDQLTTQCDRMRQMLHAAHVVLLNQVHGTDAWVINTSLVDRHLTGDILITNEPGIALGILTADCLPIVIRDPVNNVVALLHAGWRGTCDQVAVVALNHLIAHFNTNPVDVRVWFGPSAGVCCYEIKQDVVDIVHAKFPDAPEVMQSIGAKYYLDVPKLNTIQLLAAGACEKLIFRSYNICTMCSEQYCSYRRDGTGSMQRNISLAMIR